MRSKFIKVVTFSIVAACLHISPLSADTSGDAQAIFKTLHPKTGTIEIANGIATVSVGPNFRYLDPTDATTFLTKIAGNPADAVAGNEGVIFPTADNETWFAVFAYSTDGHVSDSDASSINYDTLLEQLKSQADADSKARRDVGAIGYRVVGWAQKPYYDATTKKLYWAKTLEFDHAAAPTLNYDIRILGRSGYINVKIVDDVKQLGAINAHIPEILSMINFTSGNTYADFNASTDHTAAYGIAGLIAGGVLAKVGFFKGLLVILAAFWKAIAAAVVAGFAAVGNFFRKLFRSKTVQQPVE